MPYRSRLEIISDMLEAVEDGAKKTHIMYKANLSYSLLNKYLEVTNDADLLFLKNDIYVVSEKGKMFLVRYNDYSTRMKKLQIQLDEMLAERDVLKKMCGLE